MRAVVISEAGGPEVLVLREVPEPSPQPHEVRVAVQAVGLNRADVLQRMGRYPAPPGVPSDIPGLEYSGVVEALGDAVQSWSEGDRVMGIVGGGACAEKLVVPADQLLPVPAGVELVAAAAIPEAFMTAWDALLVQGELRSGETALIHAVGSGVGTAAVQLAHRQGARVVGTSRTPEKLERCRELGLDIGVVGAPDWWKGVLDALGEDRVDGILDLVGGSMLDGNLRVLAPRGRVVVVGLLGGARGEIALHRLLALRATLRGTVLRSRGAEEKAALARGFVREVLPGFEDGGLRPLIDNHVPMESIAEAHSELEGNGTFGKLIVHW